MKTFIRVGLFISLIFVGCTADSETTCGIFAAFLPLAVFGALYIKFVQPSDEAEEDKEILEK